MITKEMFTDHTGFAHKWLLNAAEKDCCTEMFLRNWTESELLEQIDPIDQTLNIWGRNYVINFTGSAAKWEQLCYLAAKGRAILTAHDKQPMYWLSFRAGVDLNGAEFAYVIVQEDKKHGR